MRKARGRGVVWALAALLLCAAPIPAQGPPDRAELLENRAYSGALLSQIRQAKRRIICAFYLFKVGDNIGNLPAAIATELVRARQRGVEVTVILEGGKQVARDNRAAAGLLSKGGVRVLCTGRRRVTHVKALAIDDRHVFIGSHNLTQSALAHNNELSVLVDSPELAGKVRRYLEEIR